MSQPVSVKSDGFLRGGRVTPLHGYTPLTISRKRFQENTNSLAVTLNFILPTLQSVNRILEKHVTEGSDVPVDELLSIFANCSKASAKSYADRLARVACQTALASALVVWDTPTSNSMVYLWDLYPRLIQRYVGEVFDFLRVPRFLRSLLGPSPTVKDVAYLQSNTNAVGAFTASLQRNSILLFGDVVVDTVLVVADGRIKAEQKPAVIAKKVFARCTTCVCWAVGAAAGRAIAGERGEYWGEYLGTVAAPTVVYEVLVLARNAAKTHPRRGTDSGAGHHQSSSQSSRSAGGKPPSSSVPATA